MPTCLGSVLERDVDTDGPRARLTVDVPEAWLEAGTLLVLVALAVALIAALTLRR
jgi:hypothetical protein